MNNIEKLQMIQIKEHIEVHTHTHTHYRDKMQPKLTKIVEMQCNLNYKELTQIIICETIHTDI